MPTNIKYLEDIMPQFKKANKESGTWMSGWVCSAYAKNKDDLLHPYFVVTPDFIFSVDIRRIHTSGSLGENPPSRLYANTNENSLQRLARSVIGAEEYQRLIPFDENLAEQLRKTFGSVDDRYKLTDTSIKMREKPKPNECDSVDMLVLDYKAP